MQRGVIVSIQGYHYMTISELAREAINASCVGIRTDKHITLDNEHRVPIIGLKKVKVSDAKTEAYITPTIADVDEVTPWSDMVAIDYRACNKNLAAVSKHCRERKLTVVADIERYEDYQNMVDHGYYYEYVTTTFTVLRLLFRPNLRLLEKLAKVEKRVIAEGNYASRKDVKSAFECGAYAVCIGAAISNVYKLTKKYTSIPI
jgi:N-acylglucosamine-6-phosphate 2-epimerase